MTVTIPDIIRPITTLRILLQITPHIPKSKAVPKIFI
jgi:hypothetical protein